MEYLIGAVLGLFLGLLFASLFESGKDYEYDYVHMKYVEKVVSELRHEQEYYTDKKCDWDVAKYTAFETAIGIVRRGGAE